MTNNTSNPVTVNGAGADSQNQVNTVELVLTFNLMGSGFFGDQYRERRIWKSGDTHLIALSPICTPDEFSDPNCDCRSYYCNEVPKQLSGEKEFDNGWRTCLYQFWDAFVRSTKHFDDIVPEMFSTGNYGCRSIWFVIRTSRDLEYIKSVLKEVFEREIKFN
jgi:hypothetical protein